MSKTLNGSFKVSVLRNGVNAYIEKSIVKFNASTFEEEPANLLQIYNPDTGKYSVDWAEQASQPCLKLGVETSSGVNVDLTGYSFTFDGEPITFDATEDVTYEDNGFEWATGSCSIMDADGASSTVKAFALAKQENDSGEQFYYLRIIANLADNGDYQNKTIGYTLSFSGSDVGSGSLSGTEDVIIRAAGNGTYTLVTSATATQLSDTCEEATMSVTAYQGTADITSLVGGDYSVAWYGGNQLDSSVTSPIGTGTSLTVDRDDIDSVGVFTAALLDDDGDILATASMQMTDVSDPYQLGMSASNGFAVSPSQDETVKLYITQDGEDVSDKVSATFEWDIENCMGVETKIGTGSTVTIAYADTAYTNTVDGEETSGYGDVTVEVSAEITV